MGINVATISGNLGRDPEIRYTPSGKCITTFSIAVSGYSKGEKTTFWMDCKAWDKIGELCGEYLRKGNAVTVSGNLEYESWQTDGGEKRGKLALNVRDIQLPAKSEPKY